MQISLGRAGAGRAGGATRSGAVPARAAEIRRIGVGDLRAALRAGVDDFLAIPTQLVFLCVLYPVVGLVAARWTAGGGLLPLLYPLVAGVSLLGPVLAVGLYELSRRRERGLPTSAWHAFDVLRSPRLFSIALVGVMLLVLFTAWLGAAKLIYTATLGASPASAGEMMEQVLGTSAGWTLLLLGNLVGAGFAAVVLTLTAVSVPMLLDRDVTPLDAIRTSVRAVVHNPVTMAIWGVMVAAILLLGTLPVFIGLAVAMPVLGHATWHLYRRVVV